jgi:hypothetical protein
MRFFVDDHDAGNGPGAPGLIRSFDADDTERVEITAAIAIVQQRCGEFSQVDGGAGVDVLLARAGCHDLGGNLCAFPG